MRARLPGLGVMVPREAPKRFAQRATDGACDLRHRNRLYPSRWQRAKFRNKGQKGGQKGRTELSPSHVLSVVRGRHPMPLLASGGS